MAFEYLAEYATFQSVEDMDENVKQHINKYRLDLTASERAIVFALAGRSLMYPGASHLKAETIANAVGISTKTVYRSIKKLVELNIIEKVPQSKLNGIKGASIYKILTFDQSVPLEVSKRADVVEPSYDVASEPISENLSIKSFNLLKTSNTNILNNNAVAEKEVCKEYMNEYQVMLFDFMNSFPIQSNLKDELHKVVLASEINSVGEFIKAKNVLFNIVNDMANGTLTITQTLRSVFVRAYSNATERSNIEIINTSSLEKEPLERITVPFYDWLTVRDNECPKFVAY